MENFNENDKEFLDMARSERGNIYVDQPGKDVFSGVTSESDMSELNGTRLDFGKSGEDETMPKVLSNDEMIYESYYMLVELTEKYGNLLNDKESIRFKEWEKGVRNMLEDDLNDGIKYFNEQLAAVKELNPNIPTGKISDGYHTFDELYEFRKVYNAALFNEWASHGEFVFKDKPDGQPGLINIIESAPLYDVHKSWKHSDGKYCFDTEKEWFIVSAMLPTGLISNHYEAKDWGLFQVPEVEKALFEFDGHTGEDVLNRIKELYKQKKRCVGLVSI